MLTVVSLCKPMTTLFPSPLSPPGLMCEFKFHPEQGDGTSVQRARERGLNVDLGVRSRRDTWTSSMAYICIEEHRESLALLSICILSLYSIRYIRCQ